MSTRAKKSRSVEGNYGTVRVIRGKHTGKIGWYDDDEGQYAIVYFGSFLKGPYHLIRFESLEAVNDDHLEMLMADKLWPEIRKEEPQN